MADVIENSVRDDCSQDQNNFNEATNNIDNNSSSNFSNSLNNDTNLSAKDCNGSTNANTMVENQAVDTSDCPEDQTTMSEKSEITNNKETNDSNSFIEKPEINQNSIDSTDRNEISNSCDSSQNFKRNEETSDHDINSRESMTNQSNEEENKPKNDFKNVISENHNSSTNGTEDEESNLSNNKDLLSAEKIPNGKEDGDSLDIPMKDGDSLDVSMKDESLKDDLNNDEENKVANDKTESNSSEKCIEEETPNENKNCEKDKTMDNDVTIIDSDEDEDPLKEASAEGELKLHDVLAASKTDEENTFLINSDSESESHNNLQKNKMDGQINNDDDDVVLIDDDDEPPAKKLRNNFNDPLDVSQNSHETMSIRDARTINSYSPVNSATSGTIVLNPSAFVKNVKPVGPYPVAIGTDINQMPKVGQAPISNSIGTQPVLGINPNLLPALTDDMFVLEAPSFIVPYIYEKPPGTSLKEIVEKIKPEIVSQGKTPEEETALELEKLSQLSTLNEAIADTSNAEGNSTSKSKKKKSKNGDESWDDSASGEDDCSDEEARMKVLIKDADTDINLIKQVIAPADKIIPVKPPAEVEKKGDSYFESPLGRFFIDIGVDLVQEYVQADLLKTQKRKMRRAVQDSKESQDIEISIKALSKNLETSRKRNSNFHFHSKRCEFCYFKTESALVMAHHYETPHMDKNMYKCNFCNYEVRQNQEILFHLEAVHNIKGRLEKAVSYHQCPNCPFEDNGRSKLARHQPVCVKKFRPELNLCPPNDWEAPAKIPKIKPKHGLVGTATAYQAMAAQAAAQKAALASLQQQQLAARNLLVSNVNKNKKQPPPPRMNPMNRSIQQNVMQRSAPLPMINNQRQPLPQGPISANTYNIAKNSPLIQAQNQRRASGQPSISITPLPRQTNQAPNISSPQMNANIPKNNNMKSGGPPGNKSSFVICEICDGYIKDLEQLRNHMQWMHKVKIHPKMIFNRPPLNCQKCQFRFFTDQGLERHLLGSHGLVTSSMQDAANKGKDAGRCPVCGRVYQWKLLNHVSRDHNMTLKPAHLSYKCTVCTATFGMYKEFENHVYTAHSTVAKKSSTAVDNMKKGNNSNINSNNLNAQRPSGSNCNNDSLLKPLRINDEITIIPQGAKKL